MLKGKVIFECFEFDKIYTEILKKYCDEKDNKKY